MNPLTVALVIVIMIGGVIRDMFIHRAKDAERRAKIYNK